METLHLTLRIIGLLSGGVLICLAIFLKEDEEKKLINLIEEWWKILEKKSVNATSYHAKFFINSSNAAFF